MCAALREEIEVYRAKRAELLNKKTKVKRVRWKGAPEPSKKVNFHGFCAHSFTISLQENYQIQAVHLQCEIYSLGKRLEDVKLRCELEEHKVKNVKPEVTSLRKRISDFKTVISSLTKGFPMQALELRVQKTSRSSSSSSDPTDSTNYPALEIDTSWLAQQQARKLFGESSLYKELP